MLTSAAFDCRDPAGSGDPSEAEDQDQALKRAASGVTSHVDKKESPGGDGIAQGE